MEQTIYSILHDEEIEGCFTLVSNNDEWTDLELILPNGASLQLYGNQLIEGDNSLIFIGDPDSEEYGLFVCQRPNQMYVKLIPGVEVNKEIERVKMRGS
jgi:hypothetical protein